MSKGRPGCTQLGSGVAAREEDATAVPWAFLLAWADQREAAAAGNCSLPPPAQGWRPRPGVGRPRRRTRRPRFPTNNDAAVQKPSITARCEVCAPLLLPQ